MRKTKVDPEKYFTGIDLIPTQVNGEIFYRGKSGAYCRLDAEESFLAVEYAENLEQAKNGLFDDVDLFDIPYGPGDNSLFEIVREVIKEYCD